GGAAVVLTKRGRLVLECARPGRRRPARFVAPPLDSLGWRLEDWNHVGVHVSIDGSGWPVIVWRVNGATAVVSYPMPVSLGRAARAEIGSWLPIFGAAVSRAPAEAPWLDGTDWTATAIVTGADTELMWPGEFESKPAWEHLGDIADAVGAAAHFDTGGRLVFVGPPAQPGEPVAEVTTRAAITSLSIEDSLDRVRNHITVPEQRGSVKPPTSGEPLWSDDEPVKIASGDTVELVAEFSESCVKTDSELTVTGAPEPGQSWAYADYRKEPTPEGARPVPSRLVDARLADVTATGATVAIANKSRSPVWLTTPPGDDRIPAIGVCGWHVKPTTKKHTARDRESVAAYGAFPFGDTETNWRQHGGAERAARLLADLAHPSTVITGLSIVGDPRLAIGDVIAVRDPDGTKLAGSWAITGIADDHTPEGGYVQSLDVHPAPQPTS
ncbi:MAG: hypothetical protein ACRDXX_10880, partial [Stackebrandtia sp.]